MQEDPPFHGTAVSLKKDGTAGLIRVGVIIQANKTLFSVPRRFSVFEFLRLRRGGQPFAVKKNTPPNRVTRLVASVLVALGGGTALSTLLAWAKKNSFYGPAAAMIPAMYGNPISDLDRQ